MGKLRDAFKVLTRSTEITTTDTVTGETFVFNIDSGLAPDWASASPYAGMTIPGAWRASNLIADLLGQVPWDAYREYGDQPIEKLSPTPPLLDQPSPPSTRMETISSLALDYLFWGNAVALVASRNAQGWPTAILPVPAQLVAIRRNYNRDYPGLPIGAVEYSIGGMTGLSSYDVLHIKGPVAPGWLRGTGVLEAHVDTLLMAQQQQRQAKSVARHGVPTGILTTTNEDTTPEELAKNKAAWLLAQQTSTVAALGPGTDFKPLAWNPTEAQMIEARKFSLTELELIFGLPVGWLGGESPSMTYSNIEQNAINLIKFTLAGHLTRFEQAFSQMFPRGTYVRANLDALLRSDTATRYANYAIGLDKGFLTLPEVRAKEILPPLPDEEPADELPPDAAAAGTTDPAAEAADALDDMNEIDPMEETV